MFVPLTRDHENAHVTVGNHVTFQPLGWHVTVDLAHDLTQRKCVTHYLTRAGLWKT